jgi:NDP-sugar pyrophosphorylase family protein
MPDLVQAIISEGGTVASFPIVEYWLDIGQHADYNRAQEIIRGGELGF